MEKYLPLVGDYALEVLSYYIWGKSSKPSDITNEEYMDRTEPVTLIVSVNEFMHRYFGINTADDFKDLVVKNVNMFKLFFENRSKTGVELDFSEFKDKIVGNDETFKINASANSDKFINLNLLVA